MPFGFDLAALAAPAYLLLAGAAACPAPPPGAVDVTSAYKPIAVVGTEGVEDMTRRVLGGKKDLLAAPEATQWKAYGFFSPGVVEEVKVTLAAQPAGAGQWCLHIASLTVRFVSEPEIHLARELAADKGSCAYRAVLAHETNHLYRSHRAIAGYLPQLRWDLRAFMDGLGAAGPYREDEIAAAQAALRDKAFARVRAHMDSFSALHAKFQQSLDTPENYRREQGLCPVWPAPGSK